VLRIKVLLIYYDIYVPRLQKTSWAIAIALAECLLLSQRLIKLGSRCIHGRAVGNGMADGKLVKIACHPPFDTVSVQTKQDQTMMHPEVSKLVAL